MLTDRWLAARLLFLLPALAAALRLFGFRRLYVALGNRATRRAHGIPRLPTTDAATRARRIAAAVTHVNRSYFPFEARCLLESLALWWLLRREGIGAELFLGVRTILGPFESHAWVEYDGAVLNDSESVRQVFEPFDLEAITPGVGAR